FCSVLTLTVDSDVGPPTYPFPELGLKQARIRHLLACAPETGSDLSEADICILQLSPGIDTVLTFDFLQLPSVFAALPLDVGYLNNGLQELVRGHESRPSCFGQSCGLRHAFLEKFFYLLKIRRIGLIACFVMLLLFGQDTQLEVRLPDCLLKK